MNNYNGIAHRNRQDHREVIRVRRQQRHRTEYEDEVSCEP